MFELFFWISKELFICFITGQTLGKILAAKGTWKYIELMENSKSPTLLKKIISKKKFH